ncbi:unnamed protein product [Calypogeia fissa]
MSMISSLDALEAATDATSVPRAAVFQPKVKARVRKGGGGGGGAPNSVPAKPPSAPALAPAILALAAQENPSTASVDSTPTTAPSAVVAAASKNSRRNSALENAVSDFVESGTGEKAVPCEDGSTPSTDDAAVASTQTNAPEVREVASEGPIAEPESVPTDEILKGQDEVNVQDEEQVQDEVPPVAVRSNFPVRPPPATGDVSSDQDVDLPGKALPEQEFASEPTSQPPSSEHVEEPELHKSQNPKSAGSPKPSRRRRAVRAKRQAVEGSQIPSEDAIKEDGLGEPEDQAVAVVEKEAETAPEVAPTNKGGRKRKFSHSTSQPRTNRTEKEGVARKVDFSKTDLSNPSKLTMREIIRRAEAIERKKLKAEANKKSAQNEGKQKEAATVEPSERDAVSLAPQVQVVNGRIVINEHSLTIGAYATSRLNTETYTRVEENAPRLNYNSYRDKTPKERWKAEDTDVFYLALKQFGTDFEIIQNLFPGRTRRQVKAKFKKEERNNPRRLQEALAHRPQDQAHYADMINRLKSAEPDPVAGDPFENILAYTKDAVAQELSEEVT